MLVSNNKIMEIMSTIDPADYDYDYIGIRIMDRSYSGYDLAVGDTLPHSYRWDDGEQTDEVLNGTCAIKVGARLKSCDHEGYAGNRVMIIAGNCMEWGEDAGEIIIQDAEIIDIIDIIDR